MSKTKAATVTGDRLRSFFERIELVQEEIKGLQGDVRDLFSEAKGVGYDVKTMRKVLALRKMDAADRDEQEALLDVYLHALGMIDRVEARVADGASIRKAAEAEGMPKSTAIRQVTRNTGNVENGSDTETAGGTPPSEGAGTTEINDGPGSALATNPDADRLRAQKASSTDPEWLEREAQRVAAPTCAEIAPVGDGLEIPPRLRRTVPA